MSEPTVIDKMFVGIYIWYARVGNSRLGEYTVLRNDNPFLLVIRIILFLIMLCLFVTHLAIAIITLNMGAHFREVFVFFDSFFMFNPLYSSDQYTSWKINTQDRTPGSRPEISRATIDSYKPDIGGLYGSSNY